MSNKNITAKNATATENATEKTLAQMIAEFDRADLPADLVFNSADFENMVKITKHGERQNTGKLTTAFLLANTADVLTQYTLQDLILYYAVAYRITITGDSKGNSISQKLRDQAAAMKVSFKNSHAGTGKAARVEMEHKQAMQAQEEHHKAQLAELQAQTADNMVNIAFTMLSNNMSADTVRLSGIPESAIQQAQNQLEQIRVTALLEYLEKHNIKTVADLKAIIEK